MQWIVIIVLSIIISIIAIIPTIRYNGEWDFDEECPLTPIVFTTAFIISFFVITIIIFK